MEWPAGYRQKAILKGRGEKISSKGQRINQQIRAREVRVIDETGQQLGIMPLADALQIAQARGLDLVEVAPTATPPVCRLLNYGKYIYERTKKEREARKAQRARSAEIKEIRLRPQISDHDISYKLRDIRRFLGGGSKVKVRVYFRGREITYPEIGLKLLQKVAQELADVASVEMKPQMEGNTLLMILTPGGEKSKKVESKEEV
ncbi:MAG: translation initiation factor IF-3 [Anaerolineae bacterium]